MLIYHVLFMERIDELSRMIELLPNFFSFEFLINSRYMQDYFAFECFCTGWGCFNEGATWIQVYNQSAASPLCWMGYWRQSHIFHEWKVSSLFCKYLQFQLYYITFLIEQFLFTQKLYIPWIWENGKQGFCTKILQRWMSSCHLLGKGVLAGNWSWENGYCWICMWCWWQCFFNFSYWSAWEQQMEFEGLTFSSVSFIFLLFFVTLLFIYHLGQSILTKWRFLRFLCHVNKLIEYLLFIISETFPVAQINFASIGNVNSGMTISYVCQCYLCTILFVSYIGLYFRE